MSGVERHVDRGVVCQGQQGQMRRAVAPDAQLGHAGHERDFHHEGHLWRRAEHILLVRVAPLVQRRAQPTHLDRGGTGDSGESWRARWRECRRRGGRRRRHGRRWRRTGGSAERFKRKVGVVQR